MLGKIRRRGIWFTFAIAFNRIVPEFLFRFRYYTIFDLSGEIESNTAVDAISWCETEEDIKATEDLTGFRREYSSGDNRAAMIQNEGETIGGIWVARDQFFENELGVQMALGSEEAWIFAAFMRKQDRGKKLFPKLLEFTLAGLANEGITRPMAAVNPLNKPSMALFSKYAKGRIAHVAAMRFLGFAICFTWGAATRDRTVTINAWKNPIEIRIQSD